MDDSKANKERVAALSTIITLTSFQHWVVLFGLVVNIGWLAFPQKSTGFFQSNLRAAYLARSDRPWFHRNVNCEWNAFTPKNAQTLTHQQK